MSNVPNITAFVPATDWFFIHEDEARGGFNIMRLVGWATTSAGVVTGLVSVTDGGPHGLARLVQPPPIRGQYLHLDDFTDALRATLAQQREAGGAVIGRLHGGERSA